jgi:hypothetical protein
MTLSSPRYRHRREERGGRRRTGKTRSSPTSPRPAASPGVATTASGPASPASGHARLGIHAGNPAGGQHRFGEQRPHGPLGCAAVCPPRAIATARVSGESLNESRCCGCGCCSVGWLDSDVTLAQALPCFAIVLSTQRTDGPRARAVGPPPMPSRPSSKRFHCGLLPGVLEEIHTCTLQLLHPDRIGRVAALCNAWVDPALARPGLPLSLFPANGMDPPPPPPPPPADTMPTCWSSTSFALP